MKQSCGRNQRRERIVTITNFNGEEIEGHDCIC
ncbi:hypothetical protein I3843_15G134400 [Carya illinoinensis]|nr:hypothetical protein I3843_15G134400 [Carya illinoinensis]